MTLRVGSKILFTVGAMVLVGGLAAGCGASFSPAATSQSQKGAGTSLNGPVRPGIMSMPLVDADGHRVTLGSFGHRVVVISDSMTLCTEDCPLDTANIVTADQRLRAAGLADKVELLSITVDPKRDTPARLAAYRRFYDPKDTLTNWKLLTGSQANITKLWKYFGVYWEKVKEDNPPDTDWMTGKPLTYDIAHADEVIVLNGDHHERFVISGHAHVPGPQTVPAKMRNFLNGLGRQHMNRPGPQAWTPNDVLTDVGLLIGHPVG